MPFGYAPASAVRRALSLRAAWSCLLLGFASCVQAAQPASDLIEVDSAQQVALGVRLAPVRAAADASLSLPGRVVVPVDAQAVVAAPAAGVVERVAVAPGDAVRRGQLLASLQSPDVARMQRERDDARVQLELANRQANRDEQLLREGVIAASRAQASLAQQRQAAALLRERELALRLHGAGAGLDGRMQLLAPMAGVVAQAQAVPGQRVDAAAPLFRLVADGALALELDATPAQAASLRAGAEVDVPDAASRGRLLAPPPALSAGQSVVLRARLTQPGSLRAGALVQARVHLPARAGLFALPPAALTRIGGHDAVLVSEARGFRVVPVQVAARLADTVIVSGALRAGQQVAASGVAALKAAAGERP
ncbi:MAG: efflux RND transporter periplasmic adaptor subunit [Betaproteobacteria bacterium]|nr:efflux RND transporter periplasmic adaptor subunit [Betaproteobacteria bacterium]